MAKREYVYPVTIGNGYVSDSKGGMKFTNRRSVNTTGSITSTDFLISVDDVSRTSAITLTLPLISTVPYIFYIIVDEGDLASTYPITVQAGSGDQIENNASPNNKFDIDGDHHYVMITNDGSTNWFRTTYVRQP